MFKVNTMNASVVPRFTKMAQSDPMDTQSEPKEHQSDPKIAQSDPKMTPK
jgi:hypothetical protein